MLFSRPRMTAPISDSGLMMRPIGLERSESSPVMVDLKSRPASIPDINRIVVPLFPASKTSSAARRPSIPAPLITNVSPASSEPVDRAISTPSARMIPIVEVQSSPGEKFLTVAWPSPIELSITARWETDLSPGAATSPANLRGRLTVKSIFRIPLNVKR